MIPKLQPTLKEEENSRPVLPLRKTPDDYNGLTSHSDAVNRTRM